MEKKSEEYYKEKLTPEQFHVMREKGTEPAFSGALYNNHESGLYECAACGASLFSSKTKFDSATGWPSFYDAVNRENIELEEEIGFGMRRTEVKCKNCGSHLGHVFDDGPNPTGKRYCINSVCLNFKPQ